MVKIAKMKPKKVEEESEGEDSDISMDSDEELQLAFQKGLLKPGINVIEEPVKGKKDYRNLVSVMNEKISEFSQNLDWIERLDITIDLDALPLVADQVLEADGEGKIKFASEQLNDDLQREVVFFRQAQASALEGLARLKSMGIPTKRPSDYFAQMAKSDEHMLKVKQHVLGEQLGRERAEKISKLRELRKFGKKVQVEVMLKRQKEKREMLEKVKKYRQGKIESLDFLDEQPKAREDMLKVTKAKVKEKNEAKGYGGKINKADVKTKKYGFGGKKSGSKRNNMKQTPESGSSRGNRGQKGTGAKKRPGKQARQSAKGRKASRKR
nr:EOG090X0D84 [Triops cancriformis]